MPETLWWILSVLLIVVGLAGTVLPALPGTALILAGIVLGAWIDGFARVSVPTLIVIAVLAVLAWMLDYVAGLMGAKRAGASRYALIGAALGTVVGLFMGLIGVLFMPLVGAAVGEYLAQREGHGSFGSGAGPGGSALPASAVPAEGMADGAAQSGATVKQRGRGQRVAHGAAGQKAVQVGVATWLGIMLGLLAKVVLACIMVGIFVAALVF